MQASVAVATLIKKFKKSLTEKNFEKKSKRELKWNPRKKDSLRPNELDILLQSIQDDVTTHEEIVQLVRQAQTTGRDSSQKDDLALHEKQIAEQTRKIFSQIDKNGDGKIGEQELYEIKSRLYKIIAPEHVSDEPKTIYASSEEVIEKVKNRLKLQNTRATEYRNCCLFFLAYIWFFAMIVLQSDVLLAQTFETRTVIQARVFGKSLEAEVQYARHYPIQWFKNTYIGTDNSDNTNVFIDEVCGDGICHGSNEFPGWGGYTALNSEELEDAFGCAIDCGEFENITAFNIVIAKTVQDQKSFPHKIEWNLYQTKDAHGKDNHVAIKYFSSNRIFDPASNKRDTISISLIDGIWELRMKDPVGEMTTTITSPSFSDAVYNQGENTRSSIVWVAGERKTVNDKKFDSGFAVRNCRPSKYAILLNRSIKICPVLSSPKFVGDQIVYSSTSFFDTKKFYDDEIQKNVANYIANFTYNTILTTLGISGANNHNHTLIESTVLVLLRRFNNVIT